MRRILCTMLRIAALSTLAGCASVYRVSESASDDASAPAPVPQKRNPVAFVTATPADAGAKDLAAALKSSVEKSLAARGFEVKPRDKPDSKISLSVSRRKVADLAEWRVYEGKADVRVTDVATGKLVSNASFSSKGDRALDDAKAEERIRTELSQRISEWLAKVLPARKVALPVPPPLDSRAAMLTLFPADPTEDPGEVLVVQRRFMDAVGSHPGILSCRLAKEIPSQRAFVFRVEYRPELFPDGLLNTLVLDRPRLGGNVKFEIVR